jgi:hypothetical protein
MNSAIHEPRQPCWTCLHCGQNWPCETWRDQARRARRYGRPTLMIYLAQLMLDAQRDLPAATAPELVDRFLEWVRLPPPPIPPGDRPWWDTWIA